MALREVNLVPPDMLFYRQVGRRLSLWAACLLVSLSGIVGGYSLDSRILLARKKSLVSLDDVDSSLGTRIQQIHNLQSELEKLHQKQTALRAISRNQPYSSILLRLADIMNEQTWLSTLTIDNTGESEEKTEIEMTGLARSNDHLGDFLSRLAGTLIFRDVELHLANEARENRRRGRDKGEEPERLVQFRVTCSLSREPDGHGF